MIDCCGLKMDSRTGKYGKFYFCKLCKRKQRSYFEKPSVTRRNEVKKAEYRQSKFQQPE